MICSPYWFRSRLILWFTNLSGASVREHTQKHKWFYVIESHTTHRRITDLPIHQTEQDIVHDSCSINLHVKHPEITKFQLSIRLRRWIRDFVRTLVAPELPTRWEMTSGEWPGIAVDVFWSVPPRAYRWRCSSWFLSLWMNTTNIQPQAKSFKMKP